VVILLSVFDANGEVQMLAIVAVASIMVVAGFLPTWIIVVLAIIGGVLVFREITGA
jgi:hypothetical protein